MTSRRGPRPGQSHHSPTGLLLAALLGGALFAATSRLVVADPPNIAIATPAGAHTAEEAKELAERALAQIRTLGRDQTFAEFSRSDGGFVGGDLYVFCQDVSGVVVAHGGNPMLVGRNMAGGRGPDGRLSNVEINQLGLRHGSGWLEFRWPNPATEGIELKAAYVLKVDDHTVRGSGYYKGVPP